MTDAGLGAIAAVAFIVAFSSVVFLIVAVVTTRREP